MAKHTPGPWAVVGANIEQIEEGVEIATVSEYRTMTPRQAANARLIAAAPDLLEALQEARSMVYHMTGDSAICAPWNALLPRLDAAIARATGQ